jgi:hypothetical protein
MTVLTLFEVVLSIVVLILGVRILKFQHAKRETTIYGRDILAFSLIILGLTGSFFSLNQFQLETPGFGSGGGPFLVPCPDFPNVPCYTNANTGACTVANVGTSSCNLPANGCDGVYRIGIGRCETGTNSCTIPITSTVCDTGNLNYPTPFTNVPLPITVTPTTLGGSASNIPVVQLYFLRSPTNVTWTNMPVATTEFLGSTSGAFTQYVDTKAVTQYRLVAICTVASNSINQPELDVQYSNNGGSTWTNLGTSTVNRIVIDGIGQQSGGEAGNCGTGPPTPTNNGNLEITTTSYLTFPTAAQNVTELLRLVGLNGAGTGDNPQFMMVEFQGVFGATQAVTYQALNLGSPTQYRFRFIVPFPETIAATITGRWIAISPTG